MTMFNFLSLSQHYHQNLIQRMILMKLFPRSHQRRETAPFPLKLMVILNMPIQERYITLLNFHIILHTFVCSGFKSLFSFHNLFTSQYLSLTKPGLSNGQSFGLLQIHSIFKHNFFVQFLHLAGQSVTDTSCYCSTSNKS